MGMSVSHAPFPVFSPLPPQPLLGTVALLMAASPSGRHIAAFCEDGILRVLSSELDEIVFKSQEAASELATQVAWLDDVSAHP